MWISLLVLLLLVGGYRGGGDRERDTRTRGRSCDFLSLSFFLLFAFVRLWVTRRQFKHRLLQRIASILYSNRMLEKRAVNDSRMERAQCAPLTMGAVRQKVYWPWACQIASSSSGWNNIVVKGRLVQGFVWIQNRLPITIALLYSGSGGFPGRRQVIHFQTATTSKHTTKETTTSYQYWSCIVDWKWDACNIEYAVIITQCMYCNNTNHSQWLDDWCFKQLQDEEGHLVRLLPPMDSEDEGRKCLVLDLDETLVHSSFKVLMASLW